MGALQLEKNKKDYTLEEFYAFQDQINTTGLVINDEAINRVEYYNGMIWFMAGGTVNHSRISGNLYFEARNLLSGSKCEPFGSDTNLAIDNLRLILHPDLFIACDGVEKSEFDKNGIANASVIFEVLSNSTEVYDRSGKFRKYKKISSFKEYILVSQKEALVESFVRHEENLWSIHHYEGIEAIMKVHSLNIEIPLALIYKNVVFDDAAEQPVSSES